MLPPRPNSRRLVAHRAGAVRTHRNDYLGYRESDRITATGDTTIVLRIGGPATVEMDALVLGVYHYGEGELSFEPEIGRRPVAEGQPAPHVAAYLAEFFGTVESQALDRDSLDWAQLRAAAYALSATADSVADIHDVLDFTLRRIDHHSYLQRPSTHWGQRQQRQR